MDARLPFFIERITRCALHTIPNLDGKGAYSEKPSQTSSRDGLRRLVTSLALVK